jgi:prepilin-type N-terminal cleavage/methylation domain-containing protein
MVQFKHSMSRGFTLIEAIVALAIIGITLIPIMAFITNASRQLSVAADSTQRAFAQQATLGYVETINPLANPTGEAELTRALQIRWSSQEVVPPSIEPRPGSKAGDMKVGIYRLDISVIRNEKEWFTYSVRKMGFEFNPNSVMGLPR